MRADQQNLAIRHRLKARDSRSQSLPAAAVLNPMASRKLPVKVSGVLQSPCPSNQTTPSRLSEIVLSKPATVPIALLQFPERTSGSLPDLTDAPTAAETERCSSNPLPISVTKDDPVSTVSDVVAAKAWSRSISPASIRCRGPRPMRTPRCPES
jgi:hypothetical protein